MTETARRKIRKPGALTKTGLADRAVVEQVLAAARGLSSTHWMVCALMIESGMHPVMFNRLRPEMVVGEILQWPRPKTGEVITMFITPRLREALELYFERRGGFSPQYAHRLVKDVGAAVGRPEISPITFRKTFCALRLLDGESVDDVAVMMGCSVELVRKVYSALSPEERRKVVMGRAARAQSFSQGAPNADSVPPAHGA